MSRGGADSYQQLVCPEVLPVPGQVPDLYIPSPLSMDTTGPCCRGPHTAHTPSLPCPPVPSVREGEHGNKPSPTLHVEVCQHSTSSMRGAKLKELVRDMLLERGTAFSDLILLEFDDPMLKEHVLSISITDTPSELKVGLLFKVVLLLWTLSATFLNSHYFLSCWTCGCVH